jgi:nitroimidazol reductase NimA-like FMN-containing flavoprotein (pyridoxamine 5'-phosphate oxidase superfamily)
LGLSLDDVAVRAGMARDYVDYVEHEPHTVTPSTLHRLAHALETTEAHLLGPEPPATSAGGGGPHLQRLAEDECWTLVRPGGVGRVAFSGNGAPMVFPVNYAVMGHEIVLRTRARAELASHALAGRQLAFEVDAFDELGRTGWSVLMRGPSRAVSPEEAERLHVTEFVTPWAGSDRATVVLVAVREISGRRIVTREV